MTHRDPFAVMRLLKGAFAAAGRDIIQMSTVDRPTRNARFHRAIATDGYAICGLDIVLDVHGQLRIIEVNGSNQGLSSMGDPEGDRRGAEHQVEAALPRIHAEHHGAVLIAFAEGTHIVAEIMARRRRTSWRWTPLNGLPAI